MPFFLFDRYFAKKNDTLKIYGPRGLTDRVKGLFDIGFPGDFEKIENSGVAIEFIEFDKLDKKEILPNVIVSSVEMIHGNLKPAFGYIVEKRGKKIGLTGDTTICEGVDKLFEETELVVIDTSSPENGNPSHLGLNDVVDYCKKYPNVKVIPTHMFDKTCENARHIHLYNFSLLEDGESIDI